MPKRKKRAPPLPRVTVMAFSRKDLLAFCEAVESLRGLVGDLRLIAEQMPRPRPKKSPRAETSSPPSLSPEPALFS